MEDDAAYNENVAQVLDEFEDGKLEKTLAAEHGVSERTIRRWIRKAREIRGSDSGMRKAAVDRRRVA